MDLLKEFQRDERIILRTKTSRWFFLTNYMFWSFVILFGIYLTTLKLVAIILPIIGIISILLIEIKIHSNKYILTNKRVLHHYKFLRQRIASLPYSQIRDLHLSQRISERLAQLGTLHFNLTNRTNLKFKGVPQVLDIKKEVENRAII